MTSRAFTLLTVFVCIAGAAPIGGQVGILDPSFGRDGRVVTDFVRGGDDVQDIAAAHDGTLVAVGFASRPGHQDFAIARYSAEGELIAAVTLDLYPNQLINDYASRVAIRPDGRIVIAGVTAGSRPVTHHDVALVRLLPTLALDPTFGAHGTVITPFAGHGWVTGLALQADGRIVVSGAFGLMRYNEDGSADLTFGAGGRVAPVFSARETPQGVALQADGRIVVAGITFDMGAPELSVARYRSDGSLDTTFGDAGKVFLADYSAVPYSVAVQSDGRILVAGIVAGVGWADFALWRLEENGRLDVSFGGGGRVFTDIGEFDRANDVAVQPDGRIVAAGYSQQYGNHKSTDFAVARYEANGDLDIRFGRGGVATTDFFGEADFANAVVIQPGRGVVLGGAVGNPSNGTQDFGLARYDRQPPNQPPVIRGPKASRRILWPPNHKFVDVTIDYDVIDDLDPAPVCSLHVTSNEPVDGRGDGATTPDWLVTGAHRVRLRAERSAHGSGRIYSVAISCVDAGGLEAHRHVAVTVPKSR